MDWLGFATLAGGIVTAAIGAYALIRRGRVDAGAAETATEASATDAFLKGQQAFQEYTNKLVADSVQAAVAPMQKQLDEMKVQLQTVRDESHEMNVAVRARETQLWIWNLNGRTGPLPALPAPILQRLELSHLVPYDELEDTVQTRREEGRS